MASKPRNSAVLYGVIGAVVILAIIVFFAMSPVRRPRPTINGAPAERDVTTQPGGPVNGVTPMGRGDRPVNAQ